MHVIKDCLLLQTQSCMQRINCKDEGDYFETMYGSFKLKCLKTFIKQLLKPSVQKNKRANLKAGKRGNPNANTQRW